MTQAEAPVPLSMSADWLVEAVCAATTAEELRAVLREADAEALEEASAKAGVDWEPLTLGVVLPLGREDMARAAGVRAAGEGRSVASVVDVVWAVVAAVAAGMKKPAAKVRTPKASTTPKAKKTPAARKSAASKTKRATPVSSVDARVVRVFVSSTFRDMQEERDELAKRTFPQLRKLCESRGVTWGEVDLRWGITEEAKAEGQVLPTCLAEIRKCRPFFIGMLGERYGWVPEEIEPAALQDEPWVADHVGRSVTELEILQGVLNDPAKAEHAFFYLRDRAYVDGKPAGTFKEVPTPEEVTEFGQEKADKRASDRSEKLAELKERVRTSSFPVREDYPDPRTLGALVLADLTEVIDRLYPEGSAPDPLTRERFEHEAFAKSRSGVYIDRKAYVDALNAHAKSDGLPLVVIGESGSGKSALLANWALEYRTANPDVFVLPHFVGASPTSTDWAGMVRRIIGELSTHFDLKVEIPDEASALRVTFATTLHMAAAEGPVLLVIDAVNQLEDREGALDLSWVPPTVPDGVRLIVSTLPGRPLDEATKRGWATLTVEPLKPAEREALIVEYLASHSRALSPTLVEHLAAAPQAATPLYLRALLDELRVWGDHDTLPDRIDHYLEAESVDALYELILERYEQDYDRDRPHLVRDAFTLLWAARRGLSEAELLDLLGEDGNPLPRAYWSPLFLATESSLTNRSGLLTFFHDYLRQAVHHRYLPTQADEQAAHLRLAHYFTPRDINPRQIDELPWQLAQAAAWQRLFDLLTKLDFLEAAWGVNAFEVRARWAQVEANSPHRIVDAYRSVIRTPDEQAPGRLWMVATLLHETGHPDEALELRSHLVASFRRSDDRAHLQASLGNQAVSLTDRGELDGAMELLKEQEQICRDLGDPASLQFALGNQALILRARGELDGAMELLKEQERICRALGDPAGLQRSFSIQASVLEARGDLDGAMKLQKERERICRDLGDPAGLAMSLGDQAIILAIHGELDSAMTLLKEQERICRDLGDPARLQPSLANQANILALRGDLDGAMKLYAEEERICRALGDPAGLAASLANQSTLLPSVGRPGEALTLAEEAYRLASKHGLTALAEQIRPIVESLGG